MFRAKGIQTDTVSEVFPRVARTSSRYYTSGGLAPAYAASRRNPLSVQTDRWNLRKDHHDALLGS